ncbi:MAG: chalcone isomerase family protein, partial [Azonexus sp.]
MISRSVRIAALAAGLLAIPGVHAAEVAGIKVDDQIKVGANELVLNGAGVRTKVFIKVYVGALYVS